VLEASHYKITDALSEEDMLRPATFDGLEVPLRELWE
jgi:hypothetical protein